MYCRGNWCLQVPSQALPPICCILAGNLIFLVPWRQHVLNGIVTTSLMSSVMLVFSVFVLKNYLCLECPFTLGENTHWTDLRSSICNGHGHLREMINGLKNEEVWYFEFPNTFGFFFGGITK